MVQWRGWGFWVGLLFVFWIFVGIAYAVAASPYIPDPHRAMMDVQWGAAVLFFLYAASVQAVVEIRRRSLAALERGVASGPISPEPVLRNDEFMWIRLVYWPAIIFVVALFFVVATYFGYEIFGGSNKEGRQPRFGAYVGHEILSRDEI